MSDTPRTDANYVCHYGDGLGQWVPREFACELERELAAAQAQRDKAVAMLITHADHTYNCAVNDEKDCDCGLDALLKEFGK